MIQLTDEVKKDKDGKEIDDSMYLVGFDSNNLALARGTKEDKKTGKIVPRQILNYFGCVETALKRSIDYAVKGSLKDSSSVLELKTMHTLIHDIYDATEGLQSAYKKGALNE